jgi:bacteriocin biosynthesis cyclodehydratase domain-containing protein
VHIIAIGDFGAAVAERLTDLRPSWTSHVHADNSEPRLDPARLPEASGYILAAWRYAPESAALLDRLCTAWGSQWLPIWAEPPTVRIGPVHRAGRICQDCAHRRWLQHSPTGSLTKSLHEHYARNRAAGPRGYLGAAATLTAAVTLNLIDRPEAAVPEAAYVHLTSVRIVHGSVAPVHGCRHCFPTSDPGARTYAALLPVVAELQHAAARG